MSLENFLQNQGFSQSTIKNYQYHVLAYVNWSNTFSVSSQNVSSREINSYLHYLKNKGAKPNYVQHNLKALKHYFAWQKEKGFQQINPITEIKLQGIRRKKLHKILSPFELQELYNSFLVRDFATENNESLNFLNEKRDKALLGLYVFQGVGSTDVRNIRLKDLDLRSGKIRIPESRKINERTLVLQAPQVMDLMEYVLKIRSCFLREGMKEVEQLFLGANGKFNLDSVLYSLTSKLKKHYPKFKSLKQVRASVISHWLGQYNLREVQFMAGHRYISSTESYKVNRLEDLKTDIEQFHPMG